jgi:type IV secretion system protein VirB6
MKLTIFAEIGNIIEPAILAPAQSISSALSANLPPFVSGGLTIWVMVYAHAVIRGSVHTPVNDFAWRFAKISMILFFALAGGIFQPDVNGFYNEISGSIYNAANASAGGGESCDIPPASASGGAGIYSALDCASSNIITPIFNLVYNIEKQLINPNDSALAIVKKVSGVIVGLVTGLVMVAISLLLSLIMIAYMGFEIISVQVTLALAFALSPLFICSLAFEPLKNYFSNWLNVVIKAIVFQALFVVFMGIAIAAITKLQTNLFEILATAPSIDVLLPYVFSSQISFVILLVIFIFVATRIPGLAGELCSGGPSGAGLGTLLTAQAVKGLGKMTGGKLGAKPGGQITT